MNRKSFIKILGAAGISCETALAASKATPSADRMGVLVDTTACIGCRKCEWACKKEHGIPTSPIESYEDQSVFEVKRRPDPHSLTVVNQYWLKTSNALPTAVKIQCMHCDYPACVSACIVGAFKKTDLGPIIWDTDKCIGCRYCMVACPFQVPSFEYSNALRPNIVKCDLCFDRLAQGRPPACVEVCPVEALTFGRRSELITAGREKIRRDPGRYGKRIYGEEEGGGTSFMYLASRDFADLDLPTLGTNPMPGTTESIQHGIFAYFVPPVMLYALLGTLMWISKRKHEPI